jgi:hypothetical protein
MRLDGIAIDVDVRWFRKERAANGARVARQGPTKRSRSAAPGPVPLRGGLAAPERLLECDAIAEARGSGGSGELILGEKSEEKRCELVLKEPALEGGQLEGAGDQD